MNDPSRVQQFGTRAGVPEHMHDATDDGPAGQEQSGSASGGMSAQPDASDYTVQEVETSGDAGIFEGNGEGECDDENMRLWASSLVPGSLLDVRNKHGVWFEV